MFDYVLAAAVAVFVASTMVMGSFLARYAKLVREEDRSVRLAKDLWESVNARFGVMDARLIDLMAKSEVMSSRMVSLQAFPQVQAPPMVRDEVTSQPSIVVEPTKAAIPPTTSGETTETEVRVLQMLSQGPRSSAQIKQALGRSREHTARLMKGLFDRGLVIRNDRNKPYVYEITQTGRSYVAS